MKTLTFILLLITSFSYGQGTSKQKEPIKIDTTQDVLNKIPTNDLMIKTLASYENQIRILQDPDYIKRQIGLIQELQKNYLRAVVESYGYDFDKSRDFKFDGGKFIFRTEK